MGFSTVIATINNAIDLLRSQTNVKFGELETRCTALEQHIHDLQVRLDKLDRPPDNPDRVKTSSSKRLIIPDRPEIMKVAGVGVDPR